jgi:dihydroflavonol-4-reductase
MLVLGATGHIGQAVVRRALEQGWRVTAATRQARPVALSGLTVEIARVDDGLRELEESAAGHDLIVDAAAPHPLDPCMAGSEGWRRVVATAVEHTRKVVSAARRNQCRMVFISSSATLPRNEPPIRAMAAAWRRSVYPYFEAKAAMEDEVLGAARHGLPVVIVNPTACLGPWEFRREGSSFVRMTLARWFPVVTDQMMNFIDVRDVAAAIELALSKECFGRPIPLAGHNLTGAALAQQIAALNGGPIPYALSDQLAGPLTSAVALWTQTAFAALGSSAPDMWRAVPLIDDSLPTPPSPEQIAIGLTIRPLAETVRDSVDFHLSQTFIP